MVARAEKDHSQRESQQCLSHDMPQETVSLHACMHDNGMLCQRLGAWDKRLHVSYCMLFMCINIMEMCSFYFSLILCVYGIRRT